MVDAKAYRPYWYSSKRIRYYHKSKSLARRPWSYFFSKIIEHLGKPDWFILIAQFFIMSIICAKSNRKNPQITIIVGKR
jgi:hypothetical protein